jgi:hypothetical protein
VGGFRRTGGIRRWLALDYRRIRSIVLLKCHPLYIDDSGGVKDIGDVLGKLRKLRMFWTIL